MRVTIIPSDKAVYLDGEALFLANFAALAVPAAIHAVQWDSDAGVGHVEWTQAPGAAKTPNMPLNADTFAAMFGHSVAAWQTEKARLVAEAEERARLAAEKAAQAG